MGGIMNHFLVDYYYGRKKCGLRLFLLYWFLEVVTIFVLVWIITSATSVRNLILSGFTGDTKPSLYLAGCLENCFLRMRGRRSWPIWVCDAKVGWIANKTDR